jgi:hypothetical protein
MNINKSILKKPYIFMLIFIFLIYLILNFFFSGFYNKIPALFLYKDTINWAMLLTSIILSVIIAGLVSINSIYAFLLYKERKKCMQVSTVAGIGAIGGIVTGFCPICVTGIFPLVLSLLGITFSFASLPLNGIEFQIILIIILSVSLYYLTKRE